MEVIYQIMTEIHISVRELVEFLLRSGDLDNRSAAASEDAMAAGSVMHRKLQDQEGSGYRAEVSLRLTWEYPFCRLILDGRADGILQETVQDEEKLSPAPADGDRILLFPNQGTGAGQPVWMIDEIKTSYRSLRAIREPEPVHLAQARCYAYIYALQQQLTSIGVRMTYCNLLSGRTKRFREVISFETAHCWFADLMEQYRPWAQLRCEWEELRTSSIRGLPFPYPYRPGQKELAAAAYRTVVRGRKLYLEAPTGTGKTLSTLYPAIMAVGEGVAAPIFYLTAKTITRTAAEQAMEVLRSVRRPPDPGKNTTDSPKALISDERNTEKAELSLTEVRDTGRLRFRSVTLTAKEKICVLPHPECNPEACPRARGHYDRVNAAMYDVLTKEEGITRDVVEEYALRHQVCPFEFGLDLSLHADLIICDYNYVFDPHAYLRRFFAEGTARKKPVFLIDEAHNLVDRGREMYSADLTREEILAMRRKVKELWPQLGRRLSRVSRAMLAIRREMEKPEKQVDELMMEKSDALLEDGSEEDSVQSLLVPWSRFGFPPRPCMVLDEAQALVNAVTELDVEIGSTLSEERIAEQSGLARSDPLRQAKHEVMDELLEFYFRVDHFTQIAATADERYVRYAQELSEDDFMVKLLCVDPSECLKACMNRGQASILFSATLLPITYYKSLLGGTSEDYEIYAQSVFNPYQMGLFAVRDLTSRYSRRSDRMYDRIADCIHSILMQRHGNYLVFLPSYAFLRETARRLREYPDTKEDILAPVRPSGGKYDPPVGKEEIQGQLSLWQMDVSPDTGRNTASDAARNAVRDTDRDKVRSTVPEPIQHASAGKLPNAVQDETAEFISNAVRNTSVDKIPNIVPDAGTDSDEDAVMTLLCQTPGMREAEREAFLSRFAEVRDDHSLVGLCVMGGIFGEGIDLRGDKLIGVIVVGTGIPQTSGEREIIREYFDTDSISGYDYAYRFPGMNRVQQAAGRVIRTTEDVGIVVLIDERFAASSQRRLYPREWSHLRITDSRSIAHEVERFWDEWL